MGTYSLVHSAVATPSVIPDMMRMLWSQYAIGPVSETGQLVQHLWNA